MEHIDRPSAEDKEPGIFSIAEAKRLLTHSVDRGLLPYIAIGLFAGLRSTELLKLDFLAVKLTDCAIVVGETVAKKRSRRVVDICDALAAWLGKATAKRGPIVNRVHLYEQLQSLRTAAKIKHWPHNGLRHSFGSYHLAFHGDAIKTATQMGHRDSNIIHNHYKALVLKTDAAKFWALRP